MHGDLSVPTLGVVGSPREEAKVWVTDEKGLLKVGNKLIFGRPTTAPPQAAYFMLICCRKERTRATYEALDVLAHIVTWGVLVEVRGRDRRKDVA